MGKHSRIKCPSKSGSLLYKYKQYHSFVLFAIADADCTFICTDVGAYGRYSDSSVFRNSAFGEALSNDASDMNVPGGEFKFPDSDTATPLVIVADEAFPLHHNLMRPQPRTEVLLPTQKFKGQPC
jgi:hypothetical protein